MPIAPPFLGSTEANKVLIMGDDEFTTLGGLLGFHFEGSAKVSSNQLSAYELLLKDFYTEFSKE